MDIIKEIMTNISKIPLLSNSASLLVSLLSKENYTVEQIGEIVRQDNVLTARLLKVINSAAFGFDKEVTSVDKAIPYLGERLIQSIALDSYAKNVFKHELDGYASKSGELWEHSLKTAIAAKEIAPFANKELENGTAYTCGILHDIGKSVLSSFIMMDSGVEDVANSINNDPEITYTEIEKSHVGIDHGEVGYLLAKHWNLPDVCKNVILYHHKPREAPEEFRHYAYIVHMADMVAMMTGAATGMDALHYEVDEQVSNYVEIHQKEIDLIILRTEEEFKKVKEKLHF